MHDTAGRIKSASEHGYDKCDNKLEIVCQIQRHVNKISFVY